MYLYGTHIGGRITGDLMYGLSFANTFPGVSCVVCHVCQRDTWHHAPQTEVSFCRLRERGGTLTGLELIVHTDSGEWLKARVQKCDQDFKKVCADHMHAALSVISSQRIPHLLRFAAMHTLLTLRHLPVSSWGKQNFVP
jgi:hypothetical protein